MPGLSGDNDPLAVEALQPNRNHCVTTDNLIQKLLPTLYEDDTMIVVDKPAGIDTGGPDDRADRGVIELLHHRPGGKLKLEAANRLSRYESGILVLTTKPALARHIRTGLRTMRIAQHYAIVVLGKVTQGRLTIGSQQGASRGKNKGARRPVRTVGGPPQTGTGATTLQAVTQGPKRCLVNCTTYAPTTHALKAQLRSQRLRALGDVVQSSTPRPMTLPMTCLHLTQFEFHNPETGAKLCLRSRRPAAFEAIAHGARDVTRVLQAGLVRRMDFLAQRDTNAWRMLSGGVEDLPGVTSERYDDVVVLEVSEVRDATFDIINAGARWYRDTLGVRAVYARITAHGSSEAIKHLCAKLPSGKPVVGKPTPEASTITEHEIQYLVRPWHGPSIGLYLDHRDNRQRIRGMSQGKDVLNLFAYTCGFSVAGAVGGARSTVSVDLAQPALDWGKRNFEINGLALDHHEFIASDAGSYLNRAKRDEKLFDVIILDPPSFAHGKKRGQSFSIARDLPDLIRSAGGLLREGGTMMVSTNLRKMSHRALRTLIKQGAAGRRHHFIEKPPLPADFSLDPDHAKTFFVKFD